MGGITKQALPRFCFRFVLHPLVLFIHLHFFIKPNKICFTGSFPLPQCWIMEGSGSENSGRKAADVDVDVESVWTPHQLIQVSLILLL